MNNKYQHNTASLVIPSKVVTGIITGLMVVLSTFIISNYAAAVPLQPTPALSQAAYMPQEQNHWQTLDTHAHVIVYRDDDGASLPSKTIINFFVNDQYHTSILPRTRAVELVLCPGKKEVNAAFSHLDKHRFVQPTKFAGISPTLQAGKRYYVEIALDKLGEINARWVAEEEAKSVLANFKPQMHTLSRVMNERYCPEVTYTINTAEIFTQHKNSMSLSSEGAHALAALIKTIKEQFKEIDKVVVKNYSDVDDPKITAHPLSQMRANSVTTWLVNSALPSPLFTAQGKDLNCSAISASKHDRQACLDFKKSVDVEVYGARRSLRFTQ
ncbi:hypothetical protein SD961_17610 [Erwinia sp. MMLR14_017]|uniref:hypothetical protein n=1 Tax=Erwinia sp. MMLR14_017 TaxID=3093842 RepID=UPI0029900709|nr:hypothetical protein [Erwinia sp. MMLR14_017]MDW8847680.1 hypothetical protein [Erwinia sp. MMLR14_017]